MRTAGRVWGSAPLRAAKKMREQMWQVGLLTDRSSPLPPCAGVCARGDAAAGARAAGRKPASVYQCQGARTALSSPLRLLLRPHPNWHTQRQLCPPCGPAACHGPGKPTACCFPARCSHATAARLQPQSPPTHLFCTHLCGTNRHTPQGPNTHTHTQCTRAQVLEAATSRLQDFDERVRAAAVRALCAAAAEQPGPGTYAAVSAAVWLRLRDTKPSVRKVGGLWNVGCGAWLGG